MNASTGMENYGIAKMVHVFNVLYYGRDSIVKNLVILMVVRVTDKWLYEKVKLGTKANHVSVGIPVFGGFRVTHASNVLAGKNGGNTSDINQRSNDLIQFWGPLLERKIEQETGDG